MELIRTMGQFMTIVSHGSNVLYGAGKIGKYIYNFLKQRGVQIGAFAVTQLEGTEDVEGVPVYSLDDILNKVYSPTDINLIITVCEAYREQIKEELAKREIESYYCFSPVMGTEFTKEIVKLEAEKASNNMVKAKGGYPTIGFLSTKYIGIKRSFERLVIGRIEGANYQMLPWEMANIEYVNTRLEKDFAAYRQVLEACYSPDKFDLDAIDLIHTFNAVCKTDCPWIASFETVIPRLWPKVENEKEYYMQLIDCMKKENCRAIYAMSQNAYNIQYATLMACLNAEDTEMLMRKTKVLHPPQEPLISEENINRKSDEKKIHFIFIGRHFFRKGGKEVIRALSTFEHKYDFKLTLISSLGYNDYYTHTSYEEMLQWKENIKEKEWIDYYEELPNSAVLLKCQEASVGLLPSLADSYGYSVLEMQAAGCPVITTNVRALPEINNNECGWICRLPVDELNRGSEWNVSVRTEILEQELRRCFQDIFDHPEIIKVKGRKALQRIKEAHDPHKYQTELRKNLE